MARDLPSLSMDDRRNDVRYQRLMTATRRAARQGYDSVSMRELARETRLSMTTIYQFCSSKDHLIAEAHLDWMEQVNRSLPFNPPKGRTAQARLLRYVADVIGAWEQHEVLMRTLQRALYSLDAGVSEVRGSLQLSYRTLMDAMVGDEDVPNRDGALEIIGHVLDSVTYRWISRTVTTDEARRILERTVKATVPKPSRPPT